MDMTTCRIWLKNYHNVERDGVGGVVTRDAESTTVNTADNLATFVAIKDRFLNNSFVGRSDIVDDDPELDDDKNGAQDNKHKANETQLRYG